VGEPVVLREGVAADWPRFRELILQSAGAATWADGYPSIVAESEGRLLGFAMYRIVAGEGELLNLAVDPLVRRSGVGRALLQKMMSLAEVWHLEVRESNQAAIGLYASLGYKEVGRRNGYYGDGEAALLFTATTARR
jgi:ribosomal-protein-alanine N-acetyltransferase